MDQVLSILHQLGHQIVNGIIALAVGLVLFALMERLFSLTKRKKSWRANFLDVQYAFISMLYPPFIYFVLSAIFGYLALQTDGFTHDPQIPWLKFGLELLAVLIMRDILIYIRHRVFHTRPVWAFHSIHHSSEEVNWISAVRFHPAENIIEATGEVVLFMVSSLLGCDPLVLSVAGILIGFYNFFIHSNLRWTFGPLRYVLVSPVFHRWHHSDLPVAHDKNFAAMFAFLDLMLGTFYMPKGVVPETLGLSPEEKPVHPRTLAGQLWYPFKKR